MARTYPRLVGANKIKDEYGKINTIAQYAEETEARVDNILSDPTPGKDPELVDIRTPDPSYTPQRTISVAGDMTRDMQAQLTTKVSKTGDTMTGTLRNEGSVPFNVGNPAAPANKRRYSFYFGTDAFMRIYALDDNNSWVRTLLRLGHDGDYFSALNDQVRFIPGYGSPEGVVTANVGAIYIRLDGGTSTTLYVKTSGTGNTGWTAK